MTWIRPVFLAAPLLLVALAWSAVPSAAEAEVCAYTAVVGCSYDVDPNDLSYASNIGAGRVPVAFCSETDGEETCPVGCFQGILRSNVVRVQIGGLGPVDAMDGDCLWAAGAASFDHT